MLLSLFLLLAAPAHADRILIEKAARRLTLLDHGRVVKTYHVSLGSNPVGPKTREGDGKTPEGVYKIDSRNPYSKYHLALHVSYPNAIDRARAQRLGVRPGGEIMIHGVPNRWRLLGPAIQLTDWTKGCISVSNDDVEEIWKAVPNGAVVEIRP